MRAALLHIAFCLPWCVTAQTGPAGVGSSTNNVLWLDANYGITQSGGLVSQWNDRSGNSNHALLPGSIPTAKPTFVSSSVNGYPSLDFDGTDDQLWVSDANSLDLIQWHFFIVVTADVQKDYNAWMVKGDDAQENFEMLSYSDGNIHTPIYWTDNTRTFPSSASGQVTTTSFDIIEYSFSSAVGRDVYKNAGNIVTDNENKTPKVNNLPIYIANERSTTGRCVNGDIAEVVAYNAPLNSAQRIIVNNYLAAKYNRTLTSNDIYVQDNAGNGNFDHEVAGIGRVNSSNIQNDSRGTSILQINNPGGLGDDEFLLWGHNNAGMGTWGVGDLPTGVQGRWARVWRANEVNSSGSSGGGIDVGTIDVTFDLTGLTVGNASHLRLLVDANNNGLFADDTPISGASAIGSGKYRFTGVTAINNNLRFTLGTANIAQTPLPIELLSFEGRALSATSALLEWSTASEHDNDFFTVERSVNTEEWSVVGTVDGAGNSTSNKQYSMVDRDAPAGLIYYRLRQADLDGTSTLSDAVAVQLDGDDHAQPVVYPNPSDGPIVIVLPQGVEDAIGFTLIDGAGRVTPLAAHAVSPGSYRLDPGGLAAGTYVLRVQRAGGQEAYSVRIVR